MRFLFDCEDEICLPAAYHLVDDVSVFVQKLKSVDAKNIAGENAIGTFKKIVEKMMVEFPKETGELFAKMWILEENEKAPNSFKTMAQLFSNEVAVDFFTAVLPSLLQLSKGLLHLAK
jgi:hypothetical protein